MTVTVTLEDGFQVITMTWNSAAPGFTAAGFDTIAEALQAADRAPQVAATVFRGENSCFCLGNDVDALLRSNDLDSLAASATRFFRALARSRKPLIAAVDGQAAGIGMTMLLHFDAVFATPESSFHAPFVEWGLAPEAGSTILGPEILGQKTAFAMMCLGEGLTANDAVLRGLVTRVVDSSDVDDAAFGAARKLASALPRVLAVTRDLLRGPQTRVLKRAGTEIALFREMLDEPSTRRRLRVMSRALRRAFG